MVLTPFLTVSALNILERLINYTLTVQPPSHKEKVSDMGSIYYTSEADPKPPVDEIGIIEDGYNQMGMDASLLLDLDDSDWKKQIEYRYHKRYQLTEDAFALIRPFSTGPLKIRGKSMGCIACAVFNAKPVKLGIIDNISMGGLMFHHADSKEQSNQALVLDILLADCGVYLSDMSFKTITDVVIPDEVFSDAIEMRQVRMQFQQLNVDQQTQLKDFIMNHGTEIGGPVSRKRLTDT
jgi:hypothetical protein